MANRNLRLRSPRLEAAFCKAERDAQLAELYRLGLVDYKRLAPGEFKIFLTPKGKKALATAKTARVVEKRLGSAFGRLVTS